MVKRLNPANTAGVSIMDNTGDFYSLDMGSIPVRRAKNTRLMLPKAVDINHDLGYNSSILSNNCSLKIYCSDVIVIARVVERYTLGT